MSLKQLIFLIITVGYLPFAFGKETYFIVNYESSENDTIRKIYSQFLEDVFKLANNHNSILMTKENNPQVTNWKKIPAGVKLRIYVGVDDLDKKSFLNMKRELKII